jgi:hypothetical protein
MQSFYILVNPIKFLEPYSLTEVSVALRIYL